MKKRYDAVIVGGGVAAYALAALASREGHILMFENEEAPVSPPWERPLVGMGEGTVWDRFAKRLGDGLDAPVPYRLQVLEGRTRTSGHERPDLTPPRPGFDSETWLTERLAWPSWYRRWWRAATESAHEPAALGFSEPWSSHPMGVAPRDFGVTEYMAAQMATLATPGGSVSGLLRKLRAVALREGAEFLPISRLDGVTGEGVRVQGLGAELAAPRKSVCLDLSQWTEAPGLGAVPRAVFKWVRPKGVRVKAAWACDESELPVGLAARGFWADSPRSFYEVIGCGADTTFCVWTHCEGGAEVNAQQVAGAMLAVAKRYCPFFRGTPESARVQATPVWQAVGKRGRGLPPRISRTLAYAGPQSFPGWGVEGELAAVLRLFALWFPPEADAETTLSATEKV